MNKNLSVGLAFVAGIAGGLIARYIAPVTAFAQNQTSVTREIRAESFTLVDPLDRPLGTFTFEYADNLKIQSQQPGLPIMRNGRVVLRDPNGREIWSAGGSPIRQLGER